MGIICVTVCGVACIGGGAAACGAACGILGPLALVPAFEFLITATGATGSIMASEY